MILVCFGTRPEYIKVKSLIEHLPNVKTCFTGQHKDLLKDISVDFKLDFKDSFSENRLNNIVINILHHTSIFDNIDSVLVQGDTTTAYAIALSAFHSNKKVIHLEAGLRTNNIQDPFPEELNRQMISRIADLHLCPTENNKQNLIKENIDESKIFVVGNTGLDNIDKTGCVYTNKILITLHRRNNLLIMKDWFTIIDKLAEENPDLNFILPIHPNPEVQKYKDCLKYVKVIEPMNHENTIDLMKKCKFIISDSGGIQEEASFLNKKIIICRIDTERPEVLENHGVLCINPTILPQLFNKLNTDHIVNAICPFGDGMAYQKIIKII
jgi:UDP-N-acetylglucosamine 2-epimerase (non-hydrolysing)